MRKYLFCLFALIIFAPSQAQTGMMQGIIRDAETQEVLPFANILVWGVNKGTISNVEGRYILNIEDLKNSDTLEFRYVGYETLRLSIQDVLDKPAIALKPSAVELQGVEVLAEDLTVEQILERVRDRYETNYPPLKDRRKIFFHSYDKAPFDPSNQLILKKSDFVGLNDEIFEDVFGKIPENFIEYQDAIVELFHGPDSYKMIPIDGVSLEESSMKDLAGELEQRLGVFFDDIQNTMTEEDIYYKFRTGIFSQKVGHKGEIDTTLQMNRNDPTHYTIKTRYVKGELLYLIKNYSHFESKNWQFLNSPKKYNYILGDLTVYGDELVYEISFKPRSKGLFEGRMFISTRDYAVLQMDYAFASGKVTERFQLLGLGHSMNFKQGRVIFEKSVSGYYPKYISAMQNESASIDRKFSVMKKKKRFLFDKELNEIKLEAHLKFNVDSSWEMLVLDQKEIGDKDFANVIQPENMKFRKEYAYSPEMWNSMTVIAPSSELQKYKRNASVD